MSSTEVEVKDQKIMNDYQIKRLENIKRNNARLRSLGLISALEEKRSNAIAEGFGLEKDEKEHSSSENEESDDDGKVENQKSSNKRKRPNANASAREGTRKSLRLQGVSVDLQPILQEPKDTETLLKEREERVKECREVRLRAAKAIAEHGAEKAAKENPTATYEHCLMRVRSMTEKALVNRVKAIERAAGKHCVIKMAIFKSCLQDEGLWSLSEIASDALERLKALKPIPE